MHQEYQQPTQKYQQQEQTQNQQPQNQEQSQQQNQSVPEFNAYRPQLTISQDSSNQLITVLLEPNQVLWYRGQVVAANRPFQNREKIDHIDIDRLMHYLKYKWNMPTKLTNTGIDMAYYCIRRRGGGGKILYLEQQVYGQNFMIDMTKLLTINVDPLEIQLIPAKSFPQLFQIKQKQNNNNQSLILTLQSSPNNAIYEKSLGPSQKLYIGTSNVIAMSSYLSVSKNQNNGQICLTGPGIVFLEAPNLPYNMQLQSQGQMNGLVSLFFAICIISIGLLGIFLWID